VANLDKNVVGVTRVSFIHYRNWALCRVSEALDKAWKTLGEGFVTLSKENSANCILATTSLSSTYYLCWVSPGTQQRKCAVTTTCDGDDTFAECTRWHSAKRIHLPSILGDTQQRVSLFAKWYHMMQYFWNFNNVLLKDLQFYRSQLTPTNTPRFTLSYVVILINSRKPVKSCLGMGPDLPFVYAE
jgi:hypothetical protein